MFSKNEKLAIKINNKIILKKLLTFTEPCGKRWQSHLKGGKDNHRKNLNS